MLKPVNHRALHIAGYVESWSGPAGRRTLSLSADRPVDTVRIRCLDRHAMPAVDWPVQTLAGAGHRQLPQGSWADVPADELNRLGDIRSIAFELKLTRNAGRRVLLDAGTFVLAVEDGRLLLGDGVLLALPHDRWLLVSLDWSGRVEITSLEPYHPLVRSAEATLPQPSGLALFSDRAEATPTLNGRLARLSITGTGGEAHWRFPTLFPSGPVRSEGAVLPLRLHGNPIFCVTSSRWDGSVLDPMQAQAHYDAIHFHDTDMAGLDWPASHAVTVPPDAQSGVYAFEIVAGDATERIPFFVTPGEPKAPLLFIVPTATYLAYADEYLPPHLYEWIGTDRAHEFARDNELRSLYDFHSDGSGVSLISQRKPKATVRDDYVYPLCGDPHGLPVDLHFLRWCAREGIAIDVATDRELHERGLGLLEPYRGVVTGSHPEYLSDQMEAAYRHYIATGGRLAYLGGNGFAAAVAFRGDLMELRRGPTQSGRTWDGPLAEMTLALTNTPGGYFRDRGRGEYSLVGVGISLMGFTAAQPFFRSETSESPRFAWLFEGVPERFGDSGIVLGGAAGYEVDAVNFHLGSPADITILAQAAGFRDSYVDDPNKWYEGGASQRRAQRRADMTWWDHPSGGAVFCASSVSFLGALPGPGEPDNGVGRLTANLLRHFSN